MLLADFEETQVAYISTSFLGAAWMVLLFL